MALVLITAIAILLMIIACLPITQRYLDKRMGYWSLLVIAIIYLLLDIWFILRISTETPNFWLIFIIVNIAGIVVLFKTYQDIKR